MKNRLIELFEDLSRHLGQLSKRERMLVMLAALSVVFFVGSVAVGSTRSSIARKEMSIEEKGQQLQQISVYAKSYAESERSRREMESRLTGQPLRLLSHMQELATRHGLAIGSMNERGDVSTDGVKESTVDLQITSAPIDKLTAMLNDVEKHQRIVKIKGLRVRKIGNEELVNVNLSVGTYQLEK